MQGPLAHGQVDPETGSYTSAIGCMSPVGTVLEGYHIIFSIDPSAVNKRRLVAKIPLPRGRSPSYMHSMAFTANHHILIAEPMHMSPMAVMRGRPLGEGGLFLGNGTIFQVVDRKTGAVRQFDVPSFLFGHIVNAWEEDGDIFIDLTWYTMKSFSFFHIFQFKILRDKAARDAWPMTQIRRFQLKADGGVVETVLLPTESATAFELPKTNVLVQGKPYCIFYGLQTHAYRYDQNQSSVAPGPFGAMAIGKRNLCTGARSGWYGPNEFPGEMEFIPDPNGKAEDDGVLLGIVFDGNSNSSYFQILDAKTMTRVAKAQLPIRVPFPVHSSFFPVDVSNPSRSNESITIV
jgi:beta-carotene 15,15'-monooxygenase/beta,beta-carotene 9',10'-dioxygenase